MPIYSRYISSVGAGIQSINGSVVGAQQIVGTGDVNVNTVTGTGVTTISLSTPLSTFANTSLSNLVAPTAVNVPLLGTLGSDTAPAYSFTGDTNTGIYSASADTLGLTTGGSERMRIDSSGNVGIGTTAPAQQLSVSSSSTATTSVITYADSSSSYLSLRRARGTESSPTAVTLNGFLGNVDFVGYDGTGFGSFDASARIRAQAAENFTPTAKGAYLNFFTTPTGSTTIAERMRIDSAGNVGIGTTSPTGALSVTRSGFSSEILNNVYGVSATNLANIICRSAGGTEASPTAVLSGDRILSLLGAGYDGTAFRNQVAVIGVTSENWSGTNRGSFLRFETTADASATRTERMRITSSGNVLIGTTDASVYTAGALLKVASSSVSNNARMEIRGSTTTDQAALDLGAGAQRNAVIAGQDQSLLFLTNSAAGTSSVAERMRITSAGNLGIGTITPSEKLSVNGSVLIQQNNVQTNLLVQAETPYNAQTLANFYLGAANSSAVNNGTAYRWLFGVEGVASGKALTFSSQTNTGVTERMRIDSSGNVGIGISSPIQPLHVAGTIRSSLNAGQWFEIRSSSATSGYGGWIDVTDNGIAFANNSNLRGFTFSNNTGEKMRIDSSGNVGIGTTAPTNKLEVQVGTASLATALALSNHVNYASGRGVGISFRVPLDTPFTTSYAGGFIGSTSEGGSGAGNSNLIFQTASSQTLAERMRITAGGNVGINNNNPLARLDVVHDNGIPVRITSATSGNPAGIVFTNPTIQNWSVGVVGSSLSFNSGNNFAGTERMRIDNAGNVGIGTSTIDASTRLHVKGAQTTNTLITNETIAGFALFRGKRQNGTIASPTALVSGNEIMRVDAIGYDGAAFSSSRAVIQFNATENWTNTAQGADIRIYTTPNTTTTLTERVRITSNGDVGIGTSTPTNKLDVGVTAANNNSGIEITNTNSAGYGGCLSFAHRSTSGGAVAVRSQITSEGGGTNSFMRFFTTLSDSVTEKMRLTGEGRLGIGTTSPGTKLAVNNGAGTIADILTLQNDSTNNTGGRGSRIIFTGTGNSTIASVTGETSTSSNTEGAIRLTGVGASSFVAVNTNSFERMRIDSSGNVGIGSSSFGTSAAAAFGIANGTEPSTSVADQIVMGSVDLTAGNTIPYIRSEGTGMTGAGITNTAVTHKIAIKVNGTVYYLLATTDGT